MPFIPGAHVDLELPADVENAGFDVWSGLGTLQDGVLRIGPFDTEGCNELAVAGRTYRFDYRPMETTSQRRQGLCTAEPVEREFDGSGWIVPLRVIGPMY